MLFVASMSIFFVYSIIGNFVMLILVGKKYSVQKWRIFATFLNLTFEPFVCVGNQIKNRPCGWIYSASLHGLRIFALCAKRRFPIA